MSDETSVAAPVCVCGHPESEHRVEVLPFAVCRHIEGEDVPMPGVMAMAYSVTPCACTSFEEAK